MNAFDRLKAEPVLKGPARQHYVSRFYLDGFAKDRRVAIYDRKTGAICPSTPKKAARLEHLYTFFDDDDRPRFELEALFGIIESRAGSALKSAVLRVPLSSEDREYLAIFVAMHAIRTPAALAESRSVREKVERARLKLFLPNADAAYKLVKDFKPVDTSEAELRRLANLMLEADNGGLRIDVPDGVARAMSLKNWSTVAEKLFHRDWTIVHAPGDGVEYITSDSPVVLSPFAGAEDLPLGYESLHTHVLFPLSRNAALVMNGDGGRTRYRLAGEDQVESFNATIAADCYCHVFGSNEELLRRTTEPLNLTGTEWTPRVDVGIGLPPDKVQPAIWLKRVGRRPVR